MTTIGDRLKTLLISAIAERGRFKSLEQLTQIKEQHWKNWWYGQQRPYDLMIQAIARLWPEYALWIATGIDDPEQGQFSAEAIKPSVADRTYTGRYLRRKVEFDELFQTTMATSLIKETEEKGDKVSDEAISGLVDNFFAMIGKMADMDLPLSPEGVDIVDWYQQAIGKDKQLKKLAKDRREELRDIERKTR
jgi:hypothetical protein